MKSNILKSSNQEKERLNLPLNDVEDEIANVIAEDNFNKVKDNLKHLVDDFDNLNCIKMWQLREKLGVKKQILL